MTGSMKLSIAMAVYNGERFIQEQLESYLSQTRPPDELIVSDNASTDRTREIVETFARCAPFKVILNTNERNLGVASNFERAIRLCTGDIIFLSDCDDVWLPDKLYKMEGVFKSEPNVGLIISNSKHVDAHLKPLGKTALQTSRFINVHEYALLKRGIEAGQVLIHKNLPCYGHALAIRSTSLPFALPFPRILSGSRLGGHDLFISWALFPYCDIAVIGEALTLFRRHSVQVTDGMFRGFRARFSGLFEPWALESLIVHVNVRKAVYSHLLERRLGDSQVLNLFEAKIDFESDRLKRWERTRPSRIVEVLRNLIAGRYRLLANGLSSAVKDLLVRPQPPTVGS